VGNLGTGVTISKNTGDCGAPLSKKRSTTTVTNNNNSGNMTNARSRFL
jgi:hypothetical protein